LSFARLELSMLFGTAAVLAGCLMWARNRGLSGGESARVLFGATMPSSGWEDARVAKVLSHEGGVRAPEEDSVSDHQRAIEEVASGLPALAAEVIAASRMLAKAIEAGDGESVALSNIASPAEVDRLSAQLVVLETAPHDELQELVRRQLALVHQMRDRMEQLSQRRAQLLTFLRGLWARVREVQAGAPDDRLRALVNEIVSEAGETP
jgi:hypothetical protein